MVKKSLRYGGGKKEVISANISYSKKAELIRDKMGLDSKQGAIELAIDLLYMRLILWGGVFGGKKENQKKG